MVYNVNRKRNGGNVGKQKNIEKALRESLSSNIIGMFKIFDEIYTDSYKKEIFFSKIKTWYEGDNLKIGQYDKYEGIFARIHKSHYDKILNLEKKERNFIKKLDGDYWIYRNKETIDYFASCFYIGKIKNASIKKVKKGKNKYEIKYKTPYQYINNLTKSNKYGIFYVSDPTEFINALDKINNISTIRCCIYYNIPLNKDWICPLEHPFELFYKQDNSIYKEQNEYRIITQLKKPYNLDNAKFKYYVDNEKNSTCKVVTTKNVSQIEFSFIVEVTETKSKNIKLI